MVDPLTGLDAGSRLMGPLEEIVFKGSEEWPLQGSLGQNA